MVFYQQLINHVQRNVYGTRILSDTCRMYLITHNRYAYIHLSNTKLVQVLEI